ncbi:hypothetical protein HYALB_00009262 [Hymenoscyphus albidus]|uniref:Uncharacterized protein n=1 Tax=Hymenoscyphus albidus TaxID=595503 RepID=A0A9N9PZ25_9HELO|nr:hypothetical protein HYALB_00009262 [Hymenoscyphus albidus]
MFILKAISNALDAQANKEEIRESVDYFGRVYRGIEDIRELNLPKPPLCDLPSHQFKVEVTGAQYPSWGLAEGYGKQGRANPMVEEQGDRMMRGGWGGTAVSAKGWLRVV